MNGLLLGLPLCEALRIFRITMFVVCGALIVGGVLGAHRYCKRRGIDMNSLSGMLEMFGRVFAFENKAFSILILVCMYGGAAMVVATFGVITWGEGQGCIFLIDRNIR